MGEPYRQGYEYVVCDECESEVLVDDDTARRLFDDEPPADLPTMLWSFTCDNDDCEADFYAVVHNPNEAAPTPEAP